MRAVERLRSLALLGRADFPVGRVALRALPKISRGGNDTRLVLGPGVRLYQDVAFFLDGDGACVEIGADTYLNRRVEIMCGRSVKIGRHCAIAWDVSIMDTNYHATQFGRGDGAVVIGDHVWIGARAMILPGVKIGAGAVVAAGAVVTRDVPAGWLVAEVPARGVREGVNWR